MTIIVERFVDDYGDCVYPCNMEYSTYIARYCFYKDCFYELLTSWENKRKVSVGCNYAIY